MGKIFTVKFPDIGEGVVEGEIVQWLKNVGDPLKQDEPVVVVMTDKATVELPSPYPGTLSKQYFQPGQVAVKDKPLYDIDTVGEVKEKMQAQKEVKHEGLKIEKMAAVIQQGKALAAPNVRKLAKDLNIDINTIKGTGPDGRIVIEDLKQTPQPIVKQEGDEEKALIGIRKLMAHKMAESKKNIPPFSFFEQVDATRLVQLKNKFKEHGSKEGIQVTFMPFLIKALSKTIEKFPEINSSLDVSANKLILHKEHNIGIAVSTPLGLIVPVLKNVEKMSVEKLVQEYEALKQKALQNKLFPSDMKGATISLSNFGVAGGGGLWATPIINYPETAILAVARIQKLPLVKNEEVVVRDVLNLSWSFDHRVIDGDMAANVSHYLAGLIHNPASLL